MKHTCTKYYSYPQYTWNESLGTPWCHKT